ncbi:hypothetical protein AB6C54_18515 [Vibrio splendidus]
MTINDADVHSLILDELAKLGCKSESVSNIAKGDDIYSEYGILDSASLVQLIAALSDYIENHTNGAADLFSSMDENFLSHFKDINSTKNYLVGQLNHA